MSTMIFCTAKGCGKETAAEIILVKGKKPEECDVICLECKNVIDNKALTPFVKRHLAQVGQTQKNNQPGEPYAVKCESCKNSKPPKVDSKNKKLFCASCGEELKNVTSFYKNMMFNAIKNIEKNREEQLSPIFKNAIKTSIKGR